MYDLAGPKTLLKNLVTLSKPYAKEPLVNSHSLKEAFRRFLAPRQVRETLGDAARVEFVNESNVETTLISCFVDKGETAITPMAIAASDQRRSLERRARQIEKLNEGLQFLEQVNLELGSFIHLMVNRVFCFDIAGRGGGSSPLAVGVIWACPELHFTREEIAEFFVHEFTHQSVFLDDLRRRHFPDPLALANPKNYATSAIRKTPRQADLVLHSLIVGVELLAWRKKNSLEPETSRIHPSSDVLRKSCRGALDSLKALKEGALPFSERSLELLESCEAALVA